MPLYTLTTQDGALNSDVKAKLAMELTTLHSEFAGVPKHWVHVVFQEYAPGGGSPPENQRQLPRSRF
jgi:phenylpyruvate tautomerase PptA (4-oxalocrotonate tautomerase family)